MKIETKYLGQVEIAEEQLVTFTDGMPGFPDEKKLALLPLAENSPFVVLQSTQHAQICFVMADPFSIKSDYAFDIAKQDIEALEIEKPEDAITYSIVTLRERLEKSTINLLAPVVINCRMNKGRQIVLHDSNLYPLHYPLKFIKEGAK